MGSGRVRASATPFTVDDDTGQGLGRCVGTPSARCSGRRRPLEPEEVAPYAWCGGLGCGLTVTSRRGRSYERIEVADLRHLGEIAAEDRDFFYRGHSEYRDRLVCVALCQGAAKHFMDMEAGAKRPNGVKDFDVWSFFAAIPGQRFPAAIRHRHFDFGPSRFGAEPEQPAKFSHIKGRRVDVFLRDLPVGLDADPVEALRTYLERTRTDSARALAAKAAVLIEPAALIGTIAWPR